MTSPIACFDRWTRDGCPGWMDFAELLHTDLEAANEANRDLTTRLDRERALRMAAERERDGVTARWHKECALTSRLRGEYDTFDFTISSSRVASLHRRAQSAESRATKLAREVATLRARLQGAIAKIPPGELWQRRPVKSEPDMELHVGDEVEFWDIRAANDAWILGRVEDIVKAGAGHEDTVYINVGLENRRWVSPPYSKYVRRPIPPVALEASSGGARGLDASEEIAGHHFASVHDILPTCAEHEARIDRMLAEQDKSATTKRPMTETERQRGFREGIAHARGCVRDGMPAFRCAACRSTDAEVSHLRREIERVRKESYADRQTLRAVRAALENGAKP